MTILSLCEWTTGESEIPLFHIDGKTNIADLLTKQYELSVDSVKLNSEWQTGLTWMKLDVESMPLLVFDQLKVEVMAKCYDEAMTGEF